MSEPNQKPLFNLFVKTLTGTTITLHVYPQRNIDYVRQLLKDKGHDALPDCSAPVNYKILFAGRDLTNSTIPLIELGLQEQRTIYMVANMRGS